MDWSKVIGLVKKAAPTLGTALGGPVGGAAGAVVGGVASLIGSAFGVESDSPEAVYDALKSDPDAFVKLRQIEAENKQFLAELVLRHDQMYLDDVQNSRAMQIAALKQKDVFSKRFVYYYAIAITLSVFAYIGGVTFTEIPPENVRVVDTVVGFSLGTLLTGVVNWLYGSTKSSGDKNKTIYSLQKKMTEKK